MKPKIKYTRVNMKCNVFCLNRHREIVPIMLDDNKSAAFGVLVLTCHDWDNIH